MGSLGYNLDSVVVDTLAVDSLGSSAVNIPVDLDSLAGLDNPGFPDIAPDSYLSPINKSVRRARLGTSRVDSSGIEPRDLTPLSYYVSTLYFLDCGTASI